MRYEIVLTGETPLLVHNIETSMDAFSPESLELREITKKRGSPTRAEFDRIVELEFTRSQYLDHEGRPTIPPRCLRRCIEAGARPTKDGGKVRTGLFVQSTRLEFDEVKPLTVPVKVGQAKVHRTRACYYGWTLTAVAEIDTELVSESDLERFLRLASDRSGLCEWGPRCGGDYGRFTATFHTI